jgi:hypothetical protein
MQDKNELQKDTSNFDAGSAKRQVKAKFEASF